MHEHLATAGWIAAFAVLCAFWGTQVIRGAQHAALKHDRGFWICPIVGKCGPPGTPGLGQTP